MEYLFDALETEHGWSNYYERPLVKGDKKEILCEQGAAKLLMPSDLFRPLVRSNEISIDSAIKLSHICKTSLTATIKRMVSTTTEKCAFLLWKMMNTSSEFLPSQHNIKPLFGNSKTLDPVKKLRICHVTPSPTLGEFIPREKSVEKGTKIYEAFKQGERMEGFTPLNLSRLKGKYYTESFPFNAEGEKMVMSIVHFDQQKRREVKLSNFGKSREKKLPLGT